MVRHAPIHRRSDHSDIAICCGRNVRGSSLSTSVVPLSNQVTTLNHKRFKGFKMFSDGHSVTSPLHLHYVSVTRPLHLLLRHCYSFSNAITVIYTLPADVAPTEPAFEFRFTPTKEGVC